MSRPYPLLLLLAASACGRSVPGVLVGESAHFRLYVDPALDPSSVPSYMLGDDGLAALETDWADKQSMMGMPEGRKIDYHLLSLGDIAGPAAPPTTRGANGKGRWRSTPSRFRISTSLCTPTWPCCRRGTFRCR